MNNIRHQGELFPEDKKSSVSIQCCEGPTQHQGGVIELTEEELVRHIFIAGASGAGKTVLISSMTVGLMKLHGNDLKRRAGLLIFDFKGDDTVTRIQQMAKDCGREKDVRILSLESDYGYDFFGPCKSINNVVEYADRVLFACGTTNSDRFWDEFRHGLISAALTWHVIVERKPDFGTWLTHAAEWIFSEMWKSGMRTEIDALRKKADEIPMGAERVCAMQAIRTITDFETLDLRTKSNVRAVVQNAINPLLTTEVLKIMTPKHNKRFDVNDIFERGRILVVSINSFLHPQLAALVGRCIKADFYKAAMRRKKVTTATPLAMLIADEFQLCATCGQSRFDDATALPLLRSFRAGVIAASQSLAGIDRVIGIENRKVLIPNFSSIFFMRSNDPELQEFATRILGSKDHRQVETERFTIVSGSSSSHGIVRSTERNTQAYVCAYGALSRLEVGQAFIHDLSNLVTHQPVWIAEYTRPHEFI